jgi:hypothetical protein
MTQISEASLRGLAGDIQTELTHLRRLANDIAAVHAEIARDPAHARLFYENLALKLHNFYTGCERIFQMVVSELNGAPPFGFDWHRRLLDRMGATWQERPPLLSLQSVDNLREYLAFRHIVRNIYGFELDEERVERLVSRYPTVWSMVETDIQKFVVWIERFAEELAE